MPRPAERGNLVRNSFTAIAALVSAGAALVSILTFAKSEGWVGGRILPANGSAGWVRLTPGADTARALGDTIHFAATVVDTLGVILTAPTITWTSSDTTVAHVRQDGGVIAIAPGRATITATVGRASGSAHVEIAPVVAALALLPADTLSVGEGATLTLGLRALDARGHAITGRAAAWRSSDPAVATVDSTGTVRGVAPGSAEVSANIGGVSTTRAVTVTAVLARLALDLPGVMRSLPGRALDPIGVRALSRQGRPMAGVLLQVGSKDWSGDPAGSVGADTVRTGPSGAARIVWTAGDRPGREYLEVSADGLDSAARAILEVEPTAAGTRLALDDSLPAVHLHDTLPAPVAVRVTDPAGRPLPDVPVIWTSLDEIRVAAIDARTDSTGMARARWVAGGRSGPQRVSVGVGTGRLVPPLVLRMTVLAGPAVAIKVTGGNEQRGRAGHTLPATIEARVTDAAGNPAAGAEVRVEPGEGAVADSTLVADGSGIVRTRWMLGRRSGADRLVLRLPGRGASATITATAVPGPAVNLTFDHPPTAPTSGPVRVIATVTDAFGNPVPTVALQARPGAGTVAPTHVVTDARGRATFTWRLGATPGEQRLAIRGLGVEARGTLVVMRAGRSRGR